MADTKLVMSWSKCKIEIGKTGAKDAMAASLTNIGIIADKSTSMGAEEGETLTAVATGGVVVAEEKGEPVISITTRVKEMAESVETLLTGTTGGVVKTNVVSENFSMKLTPKNIGATGIKARKTSVTFTPGYSEEEGHFVDLTFKILACEDGELYTKYKVTSADWQGPVAV